MNVPTTLLSYRTGGGGGRVETIATTHGRDCERGNGADWGPGEIKKNGCVGSERPAGEMTERWVTDSIFGADRDGVKKRDK